MRVLDPFAAWQWYEVVINVRVPEAVERRHLNVTMQNDEIKVHVARLDLQNCDTFVTRLSRDCYTIVTRLLHAGSMLVTSPCNALQVHVKNWMAWERKMHSRVLTWEDNHSSSTHIDMAQSTWILTRDDKGQK